jgi:hypothetical protein
VGLGQDTASNQRVVGSTRFERDLVVGSTPALDFSIKLCAGWSGSSCVAEFKLLTISEFFCCCARAGSYVGWQKNGTNSSFCLSLSVSLSLSLCVYLSLSLCLSLSVSLSVSHSYYLSLSLLFHSLSVCLSLILSHSVPLLFYLCFYFSLSLILTISLSVDFFRLWISGRKKGSVGL